MSDILDKIISVFLDKRVLNLKDSEISHSLVAQGTPLFIDELRRHVQSLSPSLFQLSFNKDNSMTIRVQPQIDICRPFLSGRCHNTVKPCEKLHLCREFGHCTINNCHYPHNFNRGTNRRIVEQNNCQNIDPKLLVQLIQLKPYSSRRSSNFVPRQPKTHNREMPKQDDINRQVDLSYPSLKFAPQIDTEIIEMLLTSIGIRIEKKLDECENDYFRRRTIQLEQLNDVEKLLNRPVLPHDNCHIKFKRTKQLTDRTSFKLKTSLNNIQEKITESRMRLYASLLIRENGVTFTIHDLSTTNEQIFLIQCNREIDFDKVRQQYESKRQLQNKDISFVEVYECDTAVIQYIDQNRSMTLEDIERFVPSMKDFVFTFDITAHNCVEIEFLNVQAYKQWMSTIDLIKTRFRVHVIPSSNDVDESEPTPNGAQSIPINLNSSVIEKPQGTTIKLRREWAIAAAHPLFQQEYKDYIRENMGGEIEINNDQVIYTGDFRHLTGSPTNEGILVNKTNNYMQKLRYSTFRDLKPYQVNILRANSDHVAFDRQRRNDYLVIAKPPDMNELKNKIFPKTNQNQPSDRPRPLMHSQMDLRSPSMASLLQEPLERPPSPPRTPATPLAPTSFMFPITESGSISMFSITEFEQRLQQYLTETFNVKMIIERGTINERTKSGKPRIVLKVSGDEKDVKNASDDLMTLFSSLHTQIFDETKGTWTKIEEATKIIQHHLLENDLICACQKISSSIVHISHFDVTNPQFGVDDQNILDLINNQFLSATIVYTKQLTSTKFTKEWTDLEDSIRQRNDYAKNICLHGETDVIYLFGLTKLVKEYREKFEVLKKQHVPQPCKITLSEKQLKFLTHVAKSDFSKLEKQYKADGCDLSLTRLKQQGEFVAPADMHSKIKDSLEALAQIEELSFQIESSAFEVLISKEPDRLLSIVKSKCFLEKQVVKNIISVQIPTAQTTDPEEQVQQPQAAASATNSPSTRISNSTNSSSISIGNSTISILIGDLTTQAVDMIVVCSTSEILYKEILKKAGSRVQTEYEVWKQSGEQKYATSNGNLPCKKIFFLPWSSDRGDPTTLKTSLGTFVSTAIKYADKNAHQTIAFPSVGCGKLGFDPAIIAKHMIDEAQSRLKTITSKVDVSFVLLPSQQNVYDEFVKYLNTLSATPAATPKTQPTSKRNGLVISYDRKIIHITLISANKDHLIKCKHDILELAKSLEYTKSLTEKQDMMDWSQATINEYYIYCLKQHVIPTFDFNKRTVELVGPKDAVNEAEKYFYELTTETYKQARNQAVSRNVIWSVEVSPNSNTWEQYSYILNGAIEDAHLKNLSHFDFVNDKQERCRVVFKSMEEQHGTDTRRIQRKQIDTSLPNEWDRSDQNCSRFALPTTSPEYRNVLRRFNATMVNRYSQILKVERIQNVRWYKQYDAHREEFKRRYGSLDERMLFHGCPGSSSDQIIQACFNRSFAGVNGVVYGHGVYFHSNAVYSHQYAHQMPTGERTMFLARVLIGKTCVGNNTMKVPPAGHDTTSDGKDIFVTYHDAGAYADYLITYK